MNAVAELIDAVKAYLDVDGSYGTFDAIAMTAARKRLRQAIAEAEEEAAWDEAWTVTDLASTE